MRRHKQYYKVCDVPMYACTYRHEPNYSRTSMAQTPLGPWKLVRDRGISSQWGLIKNARSEGMTKISLIFYNMKVYFVFSLGSPHWGDSNEYTQYTIFNIKKENHTKLSQIYSQEIFFLGTQEQVRNSRGKRAISVRAIEVILYIAVPTSWRRA